MLILILAIFLNIEFMYFFVDFKILNLVCCTFYYYSTAEIANNIKYYL